MCVACLNATTQPCAHRWYQLVRPCHPANNLANCPGKLQLEGWETRFPTCPFCNESADQAVHESTHRLFGSVSSASSTASSSSPTTSLGPTENNASLTRPRRSSSHGTTTPLSLSRHSSISSIESERGQRHREMNERLHLYLTNSPHQVLPSGTKYYPTYPQAQQQEEDSSASTSSVTSPRSKDFAGHRRNNSLIGLGLKASRRLSKSVRPSF